MGGTHTAFAPGRVELLGNHTDYNGGVVLAAALDMGITATGHATTDGSIRLRSASEPGVFELQPDVAPMPNATWADYPLGVYEALRRSGWPVAGFECDFQATLPVGAGLSSSAAIEVATALLLSRIFAFQLEPMELAVLCRRAENEFADVNCGLLDQVSSVFGKRDHAVFLDCRSNRVERIPLGHAAALLIIHSGVRHALTGGEYNERRAECFEAARLLGVSQLRDAGENELRAAQLPEILARRAAHIIGENQRVSEAVEALGKQNLKAFGKLMTASHQSSRVNFENSAPELDALVEIALECDGVFGSRLTGGGFGGATVTLVEAGRAETTGAAIAAAYHKRTGHTASVHVCRAGAGAIETAET